MCVFNFFINVFFFSINRFLFSGGRKSIEVGCVLGCGIIKSYLNLV